MAEKWCPKCGNQTVVRDGAENKCTRLVCSFSKQVPLDRISHLELLEEILSATIINNSNRSTSETELQRREVRRELARLGECPNGDWPELIREVLASNPPASLTERNLFDSVST